MRGVRLAGLAVLGVVVLAGLLASCGYVYVRGSTLPQRGGELALDGLRGPVEVRREPSGVPHIRAESEHDLHFALGVVHAQDRLWQMEFRRRVGAGRLAEVVGEDAVEQDRFLRTWGFYRAAEDAYRSLSPEGREPVDAYVAGVNAYLEDDPSLPPEFRLLGYEPEPWRPADVLVWAKMMSLDLSGNYESELERYRLLGRGLSPERIAELMPPYPEDAPVVLEDEVAAVPTTTPVGGRAEELLALRRALPRSMEASNNWVVSGERTESGLPLLADDPHLGLQAPSLWYLAHLESPTLKAVGATLPGLPSVVIGRNDRIAWGVTNVGADVQDLYALEESPDGAGYVHRGEEREYQVREETIRVDGGEDVVLRVRESVYGPVVSDVLEGEAEDAPPLALRWTSLEPEDRTIEAYLNINRAENWEEFDEALRLYKAPSQSFVYADVEGNIGYVAPGAFPVRRGGHTGLYPVPGTGEWDWRGRVPFEEWPRVLNPPEGFVVTANNKVTPEGYPHDISLEWAEPYRAERIRAMILERGDDLTVEDMADMQLDQHSLLFEDFRPVLESLELQDGPERLWRDRLLRWNGDADTGSREATVFAAWYSELARLASEEVGADHWDEPRYLLGVFDNGDPNCGGDGSAAACRDFAARALERALDRLGDDVPAWGLPHQATFEHVILSETPLYRFSDRDVPFGGDRHTVNVGPYDLDDFRMQHGAGYRHIVDLADPEGSRYIHTMGQSGNFLSGHYDDLLGLWQGGYYLPMRTEDYDVSRTLTLMPED